MEKGFISGSNNARPASKQLLEFDLNEAPPSPNEPVICGCCRKLGSGDLMFCCMCGSGFHLKCLGAEERQAEWKCLNCLLKFLTEKKKQSSSSAGGSVGNGGGFGFLDINAPPPQEMDDEGEGFVTRTGIRISRNMQGIHRDGFVEHTLNAAVMFANVKYVRNGLEFQKASSNVTPFANSGFEAPMHHRLNSVREKILSLPLNGKPQGIDYAPMIPQNYVSNQVYLQGLRDHVSTWGGTLGEGWRVEFEYCNIKRKSFPVYCAPDGSKFDTKEKVSNYLQLLNKWKSSEVDEINKAGFPERAIHTNKRTKLSENKKLARSRGMLDNGIISFQGSHNNNNIGVATDLDLMANDCCVSESFLDDFPVQFEDFFVISVGKIDPRPSFHTAREIWPIGYRSIWHDRTTASVFVCQVLDSGNSVPVFRVHRLPCIKQSIPNASTVIWRPKVGLNDTRDKVPCDDSTLFGLVGDDDMSIQSILTEYNPPHLDIDILSCTGISAGPDDNFQTLSRLSLTTDSLAPRSPCVTPENFGSGDVIHEFSVDGSSPSSVWKMVSETLIDACRKVYDETGSFRFGCKHGVDGYSYFPESSDSLSKFCYSANPMNNLPGLILSTKELNSSCEVLSKWITLDRFGLDMGFVQELIEQLPGVTSCSNYQSLCKRIRSSALQTVGSGVLLAKRKNDKKVEKEPDSSLQICKRPNHSGKQLSSKLPQKLIGDVLQACDFSWRFSEVIELGAPFSLPEIEDELINPWLDAKKSLQKSANEIEYIGNRSSCNGSGANGLTSGPTIASYTNFHGEDSYEVITMEVNSMKDPSQTGFVPNTHRRCTGAILANSHTILLKVVIGELLSKVIAHVKPNIDSGELKTRRGKKKDLDSSVSAKKTKLDMLPINELTWPELARRYILAVLSMYGSLDSSEMTRAETTCENVKVFHCFQGDGGMLCGSLTGVAAMEADAVLLAEASKKIFGSTRSKADVFSIVQKDPDSISSKAVNMTDDEIPEWAQALEPVRKLPTNVGARIRNCIYKALEMNPPEWAEETLKQSICKEVYRGNASGPTKRLVMSVLSRVAPEDPKVKPEKKEKGRNVKTLSDIIMKQCRIMLRQAVTADEERVFCNLLGRTLGNDDKGLLGHPAMVSRPLDFRTIDLRLTAGAYGGSHETFIEDIREVWHNIRIAYGDRPELADLAETLSQKFENLYDEEVLSLVQKVTESADPNNKSEELKDEVDNILARIKESSLPKAPWEDGVCKICGMDKDDDSVLLCDRCDSEYHTYCLDPPLARIPEGNWYCPSCAAYQTIQQDGLCGSRLVRPGRRRRLQSGFSQKIVETLAHLADMMELKEYWELTLEERVFLLKYLCDEALSSSVIRDHLDHCASLSVDMQSKLRSFTSELKHLKSKEDILVSNSAKSKQSTCSGELGSEVLASMLNVENRLNNSNLQKSNHGSINGPLISSSQAIPEKSFDNENASKDYQLELSSVKNELSSLQDSIENLESETHKVAIRKELLGRDAAGRIYWAFGSPNTCQKVIVSGSWMVRQGNGKEIVDPIEENENSSWACYESDAEICELLGWLRDDDAREMELKESIMQLQRNKLRDSDNTKNHFQNKVKLSLSDFALTKAKTVLAKKFGSILEQGPTEISKSQGSRVKVVNYENKLNRCDCLELLWPSRHHCLLCHRTFCTAEDLEGHKKEKCKMVTPVPPNSYQENEGSSKGKRKIHEGPTHQKSLESRKRVKEESKVERQKNLSAPTNNQNFPDFPFNFEEIKAKFVTKSSLKEEVSDIGLIGSGGTPLFVTQMSACYSDPALLMMGPTKKIKANSRGGSTVAENLQQKLQKEEYNPMENKCIDSGMNEPSKADRFKSKGASSSSQRNKRLLFGIDKFRIISQSSLRPLEGKVTVILKQLKINLLDMDSALPEEALRPSRTTSEKRRLWREFVKAAVSIYEMIQATIILEDMIKTEYLKNDWWYWSSPSAAAKVSTISALALRIYALDSAIIYEKSLPSSNRTSKPKKEKPQNSNPQNTAEATSPPLAVVFNLESAENSKPKTRQSKRKKILEGEI